MGSRGRAPGGRRRCAPCVLCCFPCAPCSPCCYSCLPCSPCCSPCAPCAPCAPCPCSPSCAPCSPCPAPCQAPCPAPWGWVDRRRGRHRVGGDRHGRPATSFDEEEEEGRPCERHEDAASLYKYARDFLARVRRGCSLSSQQLQSSGLVPVAVVPLHRQIDLAVLADPSDVSCGAACRRRIHQELV